MPESAAHAQLVRAILAYVERDFGSLTELAVRDDSNAAPRSERPPNIGGYVPDVYATDVPTTIVLVGEAKTRRDLETVHSRQQVAAFLDHLASTPNGVFVLSVPLVAGATARRLLGNIKRERAVTTTRTVVLDGLV